MESVKKDFGPEDLIELADRTGVAVATVRDGYFLVFTKRHLEQLLAKVNESGLDKCCVFVRYQTFEN
jgi:hypothetical protein